MQRLPGLYISNSDGRGRGVFTAHSIERGDLIEICPLILVAPEDVEKLNDTGLFDYYFHWPEPEGSAVLALGYGSLYNHNGTPNAQVIMDRDALQFEIHCVEPIKAGGEIFIDYTGEGAGEDGIWFEEA